LKGDVRISENQFGFMSGWSTMEAIHLLHRLMEFYIDRKKDLHMEFVNLEKAYGRVPRKILWRCLEKRNVSSTYIRVITDTYKGVSARVRTLGGQTNDFPIDIGLYQGSKLSLFLFTLVMDEPMKGIQEEIPRCMLFADDTILVDKIREGVNNKLKRWRNSLEIKGFRLSRSKIEYLKCHFIEGEDSLEDEVVLGGVGTPTVEKFKYLGLIIQEKGDIDDDVNHRIKMGRQKWRDASKVLCDEKISLRRK